MDFLWVCPVIMWPLALYPFCGSLVGKSETYRWLHFPSFWKPGEQKWVWQEAKDNERIWGSKEKFWGWGEKGKRSKRESERVKGHESWLYHWLHGTVTEDSRAQKPMLILHIYDCSNVFTGFPNLEIRKPACSSSLKHKRLFHFHSMKVSVV